MFDWVEVEGCTECTGVNGGGEIIFVEGNEVLSGEEVALDAGDALWWAWYATVIVAWASGGGESGGGLYLTSVPVARTDCNGGGDSDGAGIDTGTRGGGESGGCSEAKL